VPLDAAVAALEEFQGVRRRLERVGFLSNAERTFRVPVFDDYAHNPAKITASWNAVAHSSGRVIGVWRPHGFGPLSLMFEELVTAFSQVMRPQDILFLLPVYYAGGTARGERTAEELARALAQKEKDARHVEGYEALEPRVRHVAREGDAILIMGARDPKLSSFARKLCTFGNPPNLGGGGSYSP